MHALRARLGRKDSAARLLAGLPDSESGVRAAAWSLAPHLDPDIEKKLLAEAERRKDPHTQLALAMALANSAHADTRTRMMTWLKKMPLYQEGGHIEPAFRLALETLIDRGEPGALERAAQYWAYGVTSIKQETFGLITRAKTDEAAALLLESLNTSIDESRKLTPLVLETIRDLPKGPKTRDKLLLLLARNQLWTPPSMLPLFVEVGEEKAFEDVLEKAVRKSQGPWVPLRSLDLLSRTTHGKERLRVIADDLAASQEPSAKVTSSLARMLSGGAPAAQEWRTAYLAGASHETALIVAEFRLLEAIEEMGRRARNELSPAQDRGLDSAIPLMTCTALRPPLSGSPTYWPDLARFLRELTVWIRTHRAMTFEQVLAQALRARGYGVAGASVTVADAETLVAALEDREDAIAVNAAWMLSRLAGRPPRLSAMEGDGRGFELIRPSPVEIADWKRWLDARK